MFWRRVERDKEAKAQVRILEKFQAQYEKRYEQLVKQESEMSQAFDKAIMTAAGGLLAFSIGFMEKIAPHPIRSSVKFVLAAWILFAVALLSITISFVVSQKAFRLQRELDEKYFSTEDEESEANSLAWWTNWLNIVSLSALVLGAVSLIAFAYDNIEPMDDQKLPKHANKGLPPAKPPAKPTDAVEKPTVQPVAEPSGVKAPPK